MDHIEAIDSYINGNISTFKNWLKMAKKLDLLNAIEYATGEHGLKRHDIINTMRIYLER